MIDFFQGAMFVKRDEFTVEFIIDNILKRRPRAMLGGEIWDFQRNVVPKFLKHLKEVLPELFNEIPEEMLKGYTFTDVGRYAFLKTLKPDIKIKEFIWDGEKLYQDSDVNTFLFPISSAKELIIIPDDDTTVEVKSDDWVLDTTQFKN
jgi:hypothetical protein